MLHSIYITLVFVAALAGLGLAAFAVYHRNRSGALPLAAFSLAGSLWGIASALTIVRTGREAVIFWSQVSLTVSVVVPVAWFLLVVEYTGRRRWLRPRYLAALALEPVLFVALVWTNDRHQWVWAAAQREPLEQFDTLSATFGIAFWGHQVYAYLLFTAGAALVARMLFRSTAEERWLGTLFIAAISFPVTINTVAIYGFFPIGLEPTGVATIFAAAILAVAVLNPAFRNMAPITREIGREAVLEDLDDGIVILDESEHVLYANPAGLDVLDADGDMSVGRPLTHVSPELAAALPESGERRLLELERDGRVSHYDLRVSSLYRGYGAFSGTVLSFRNVTAERERRQRLDVLNRLLRHNIRNKLNLVRGEVELAQSAIADDEATGRLEKSVAAVDDIVSTSDKIGRLSRILDLGDQQVVDIAAELRTQKATGQFSEFRGEVHIDLPEHLPVQGTEFLIVAFEELVENGLEYNDSAQPRVVITVNEDWSDEDRVVISISDNGPGIDEQEWRPIVEGRETPLEHTSGVGLWLANWVVGRTGGTLAFDSDDGTTVHVQLPRGRAADGEVAEDDRVR